jgi:hypothetical protein
MIEKVVEKTFRWMRRIYGKFLKIKSKRALILEAVFANEVWQEVKKTINSGYIYFVITPVNYGYACSNFGLNMPKEKWEQTIAQRYNWIKAHGGEIELHVHLSVQPRLMKYTEKRKMVCEAYGWMKKKKFAPKLFMPGWWCYDKDILKIVKELGLKPMKRAECWGKHDYELIGIE